MSKSAPPPPALACDGDVAERGDEHQKEGPVCFFQYTTKRLPVPAGNQRIHRIFLQLLLPQTVLERNGNDAPAIPLFARRRLRLRETAAENRADKTSPRLRTEPGSAGFFAGNSVYRRELFQQGSVSVLEAVARVSWETISL